MPRQEKSSRLRLLPGRIQLQQREDLTGSIPTTVRFSNDGRTGNYPVRYNDIYTINFGLNNTYLPGVGLPSGSIWLGVSGASDVHVLLASGTIQTTGSVKPAIVDDLPFIGFVSGVALTPFRDSAQFASDGKTTNSPFFITGSHQTDVGEGFSSPLWSKQVIEVKLDVASPSTLTLTSGALGTNDVSYPIAYYNFVSNYWEPIGLGRCINNSTASNETLDRFLMGFSPSLFPTPNFFADLKSIGYAIGDFGFPYAPKYHATSSQLLSMASYITEPFMLEKIVLEVSATWAIGGVNLTAYNLGSRQTITSSTNTYFVLNQRTNQNYNYTKSVPNAGEPAFTGGNTLTASVPTNIVLSSGAALTRVDTIRDMVGFGHVYSFASGVFTKTIVDGTAITSSVDREFIFDSNDTILQGSTSGVSGANWTTRLALSMSACTPSYTSNPITDVIPRYFSSGDFDSFAIGFDGYRTGLGLLSKSSRGLVNDFFNSEISKIRIAGSTTYIVPSKKRRINPYLLFPSDKLVVGWHLPISNNPGQLIIPNQSESTLTFHTGSFKLVLYGSYVRENKEHNETLNQLLSSNAVHEVIE
jgi:hypothetical protein